MQIVTVAQMRQLEQDAFASSQVTPEALMNRAGRAVANHALAAIAEPKEATALILVGPGNNGGDGLVVAGELIAAGLPRVVVWLYGRDDFKGAPVADDVLSQLQVIRAIPGNEAALAEAVGVADVIVDAVYGIGGRDELSPDLVAALEMVNARAKDPDVTLIAVDIPTGVNAFNGAVAGIAFQADLTVTLIRPKLGLYRLPGMRAAGRVVVETLGLDEKDVPADSPRLISRKDAVARLPRRAVDAHKGDAGSLMIIGGSLNYFGAPVLAAHAALRSGVGMLTLAVPRSILGPVATQVAESTYLPLPEGDWGVIGREAVKPIAEVLGRYTALQIGNGIGREESTGEFLGRLFGISQRDRGKGPLGFRPATASEAATDESPVKVPVLFDADGLNWLSTVEKWWEKLSHLPLLLTPHHGELARLRGVEREEISAAPWQAARAAAREWGQTVVLKGGYTVIATPERGIWVAPLANPALASAGTGDTLAGLLGGLLAQGLAPLDAAILGVWLGSRAGDLARTAIGTLPLLASDLPAYVARAIQELE